ncbi:MAG: hypothetical protein Udaeo2_32380 [Candidatus Udaeobacter sp.]|nr:MAG: hypothetical protein Udaeo2_32380 [Candidatus Udaeobacter sp.]
MTRNLLSFWQGKQFPDVRPALLRRGPIAFRSWSRLRCCSPRFFWFYGNGGTKFSKLTAIELSQAVAKGVAIRVLDENGTVIGMHEALNKGGLVDSLLIEATDEQSKYDANNHSLVQAMRINLDLSGGY